uniref:2',3'-cyclic-nucleotide 3'-phosphodiesterase n=1 Tax=Paramormyrops kingsleyae TaxID=1676925 RepID=A0A3B3Q739_9TELE|nr:2',3'-cyclic-nucleotide 3'-phosphodiesterase isoform X1 [Paramormyrops kingsleyae]XP_023691325.1 2',3'-cyclic-nucleotide 3'-phosphodiesterase isoform X1 [Paramormyrops kingsleyae]
MENQDVVQDPQVNSSVEEQKQEEPQPEPVTASKQEPEQQPEPVSAEPKEPEPEKTSEPVPEKQPEETTEPPPEPEKEQKTQPEGQVAKTEEPGPGNTPKGEVDKILEKTVDHKQEEKAETKMEKPEPDAQPEPKEVTGKSEAEVANQAGKPAEAESKEQENQTGKQEEAESKEQENQTGKQEEAESKEQENQDKQASEDAQATEIAEGSFSFTFLEDEATTAFVRSSRTLIIVRGLPGSGKSKLASTINTTYQGLCTIICADNHGIKPEKSSTLAEGFKAMDAAIVECLTSAKEVVVVDDTNHTHSRVARLEELAEEHQYLAFYVEPRTPWNRNVEQLCRKTHRKLDKSQMQTMLNTMSETSVPFFFGWFLSSSYQDKLRSMASDFLKILGNLDAFKKHIGDFSGDPEKGVDLEQYFSDKGVLHCTTKFCDYGKEQGAKEYMEKQEVCESYGRASELELTALFITPRTAGAQVSLSEAQLQLWPEDSEKEDLPRGSRAHVTLGCAEGVEPVQTGLDLLEIIAQKKQGEEGEKIQDLDLGALTYYGKGAWMLSLKEPIRAQSCFSSYYGPKKGDGGKESEKKKKLKCTVM